MLHNEWSAAWLRSAGLVSRLLAVLAALDDFVVGRGHLRPLARAAATAWPTTMLSALGLVLAFVGSRF